MGTDDLKHRRYAPEQEENRIGADIPDDEQSALLPIHEFIAPQSHREHARWIIRKSIPIVTTSFLHQIAKWIVIVQAGRMGSAELGAIAMAHIFENMSTKLVTWSLRSALGTLCSQAWTGAKDKTLVGVYLQRAYFLFGLFCIPIAMLWMGSGVIFNLLKQNPDVAHATQIYLVYQFPGFVAHGCYVLLMAYLQAQGIMRASAIALTLALPFNLLISYILVYHYAFGIAGISVSLAFYYIIVFGLLVLYTAKVEGKNAWGGWSKKSIQDVSPLLQLFWPSCLSAIWTIGAQAVITFSVSYLGKSELAAQAILLRTNLTLFALGRGFQNAMVNRIGNDLGRGSPLDAKRAVFTGSLLALGFGIICTTALNAGRKSYPYLFTSDEYVAAAVADVIPVFTATLTVNMFRALSTGVLNGLGRQKVTATVSFISYFVVSIPLCYTFAFILDGGLVGLWIGQSIGYLVYTVIQSLYIVFKVDWSRETQKAKKRIAAHQKSLSKPSSAEYGATSNGNTR
ncbi:mate-domain-containing protein [Fennellomyces sp. T-0311]|nr:mate-domain-containing protein [Fennellomyces sp. T-0311]